MSEKTKTQAEHEAEIKATLEATCQSVNSVLKYAHVYGATAKVKTHRLPDGRLEVVPSIRFPETKKVGP